MSFEGDREVLCTKGHYHVEPCGLFKPARKCPVCSARFKWAHIRDITNGSNQPDDPDSFEAEKVEVGFTDEWKTDHYGNKYAVKHLTYKPAEGSRWKNPLHLYML